MTRRTSWLITSALGAAALVAGIVASPGAQAQPVTGIYVGAGGGANLLQDEEVRLNDAFPGGKTRWDVGAAGLGSVGYGFGNGFRVEIEGNYRYNGLQHYLGTPYPTAAGGQQQNYGVMANALFDMDIGLPWLYPYFGGGVGYSWTRWDHVHAVGSGLDFNADGTSGNFAYQGIFGLSFPVAPVPGLSLTAEYRFFSVQGPEQFNGSNYGTQGPFGSRPAGVSRGNADILDDFNHSFLIGLRYELNPVNPNAAKPAAPVPVAAPAPAPARTYLVFFDWDRADLTGRARQIISEAAQASTRVQTTRINVNGYTDLSGTPQYNLGLSVRRARAVQAELIRDGVPPGEIVIRGFGEADPLVPTAQGVREPQNRRVEIILR